VMIVCEMLYNVSSGMLSLLLLTQLNFQLCADRRPAQLMMFLLTSLTVGWILSKLDTDNFVWKFT